MFNSRCHKLPTQAYIYARLASLRFEESSEDGFIPQLNAIWRNWSTSITNSALTRFNVQHNVRHSGVMIV